ncbi:hypothetical protein [Streptomyces sp. NTH33]|uniref:hypothetical protein n=1 Tax=Streptomyces sp. NTH33 TaxID=1735453 RepID=UPI0015E8C1B8|nr:hypothetical protein [Streptomyces sp. NTH33]
MYRNLAELAHAALTAPGTGGAHAVPVRLDGVTRAAVADTCVRGDLGFALLLHRRKDGFVAEELYSSSRGDGGSWDVPDHLSGSMLGFDPTSDREIANVLRGASLVFGGESEMELYTGRPQSDEGYELLRFHQLLVTPEADHLEVEDTSPGAGGAPVRTRGAPASHFAVVVCFPGERFTVRAMTGSGTGARPLGDSWELTGPDPDQSPGARRPTPPRPSGPSAPSSVR